jgi:hypothetical protein
MSVVRARTSEEMKNVRVNLAQAIADSGKKKAAHDCEEVSGP